MELVIRPDFPIGSRVTQEFGYKGKGTVVSVRLDQVPNTEVFSVQYKVLWDDLKGHGPLPVFANLVPIIEPKYIER